MGNPLSKYFSTSRKVKYANEEADDQVDDALEVEGVRRRNLWPLYQIPESYSQEHLADSAAQTDVNSKGISSRGSKQLSLGSDDNVTSSTADTPKREFHALRRPEGNAIGELGQSSTEEGPHASPVSLPGPKAKAMPAVGVAVCIVGSLLLAVLLVAMLYHWLRRKKKKGPFWRRERDHFGMSFTRSAQEEEDLTVSLKDLRDRHDPDQKNYKMAPKRKDRIIIPPPAGPLPFTTEKYPVTRCEDQHSPVDIDGFVHMDDKQSPDGGFELLTVSANTIIKAAGNQASLPLGHPAEGRKRQHQGNAPATGKSKPHATGRTHTASAGTTSKIDTSSHSSPEFEYPDRDAIFGSTSLRSSSISTGNLSSSHDTDRRASDNSQESASKAAVGVIEDRARGHSACASTSSSSSISNGSGKPRGIGMKTRTTTSNISSTMTTDAGDPELSTSIHSDNLEHSFPCVQAIVAVDVPPRREESGHSPHARLKKTESVDMGTFEVLENELVRAPAPSSLQLRSSRSPPKSRDLDTSTYASIPSRASALTQSHSPHGNIHFSLSYLVAKQRLVVNVHRAENLSVDVDRRAPHTLVKIELKPPTTADTVCAETRLFMSDRNPQYNEEVVFDDYSASEISVCTLNLKVYRIPPSTAAIIKPSRKRIGVHRMRLRSVTHGKSVTYDAPLESGQRHKKQG